MGFDARQFALHYYFGDLDYWRLPQIAADALEQGFDGEALRRLAALNEPIASDIRKAEIDAAFRDMGVEAPISRDEARLALALKSAERALRGDSNVFNEATSITIHLCGLEEPPPELRRIVKLSDDSEGVPRWRRRRLEEDLRQAMLAFLDNRVG